MSPSAPSRIPPPDDVVVHGIASDEEIAAVIAALSARPEIAESRYENWRRTRLAALRHRDGFTP